MGYVDRERQREYQRGWLRQRRLDFFVGKECVQCGSTEKLELDHIDPATKVSHNIWSWSVARREAELIKCQVLCQVCHQTKSDEYQSKDKPCGTWLAYRKRGCRCQPCKDSWAARRRWLRRQHIIPL